MANILSASALLKNPDITRARSILAEWQLAAKQFSAGSLGFLEFVKRTVETGEFLRTRGFLDESQNWNSISTIKALTAMSMGLEIASAVTGHYGHTHEKNLVIENIFLMHKVHNRWLGSHRNTYSWNLIHLSCYLQLAASEIGLKWENTQPSFERRLAIIRKNRGLSPRHG